MTPATVSAPRVAAAGTSLWQRTRWWLLVLVVVAAGALLAGVVSRAPSRPLDPASPAPSGSEALSHVLRHYGVHVHRTTSLDGVGSGAVLVTAPDEYSSAQLRRLAGTASRLTLLAPSTQTTSGLGGSLASIQPDASAEPSALPGCSDAGAVAADVLDVPSDAVAYDGGGTRCYGGLLVLSGHVAVLGSRDLLRNDHLDDDGVAALDVNVLTDGRADRTLTWLLPGPDAAGPGPTTVWDLFPRGTYRAAAWLVLVALVLFLWRVRRLGRPVPEPLPVVVRAAELVEGHGRLHARAHARDRTCAALRTAALTRLTARLNLPRRTDPSGVAAAVAQRCGRPAAHVADLLAGPVPADDDALIRLAQELDRLEREVSP